MLVITKLCVALGLVCVAALLGSACGSDEPSNSEDASTRCTPVGEACGSASNPCCFDGEAETRCMDRVCAVCADTGDTCSTDDDCCLNRNCTVDGICCTMNGGGCSTTAECCSGTCSGTRCCLPAGTPTTWVLDCCSGQNREVYEGSGSDRQYAYSMCL